MIIDHKFCLGMGLLKFKIFFIHPEALCVNLFVPILENLYCLVSFLYTGPAYGILWEEKIFLLVQLFDLLAQNFHIFLYHWFNRLFASDWRNTPIQFLTGFWNKGGLATYYWFGWCFTLRHKWLWWCLTIRSLKWLSDTFFEAFTLSKVHTRF